MAFRVELSDRAIYDWLHSQQARTAGERWFVALRDAIGSLSELPLRCRVAPESRDSPVEVRQLLYGRNPHVYRILVAVDDDLVQVLHVRHARRGPLARL